MERVLVVAAHSDDETLGCGGTLKKHVEAGDSVSVLWLTDGVSSRETSKEEDAISRDEASRNAARILGIEWTRCGSFPDNAMDSVPLLRVAQFIESFSKTLEPTLVYTHHSSDLNVDHRVTNQAVLAAFRPQPGGSLRELRAFEVPSATEWSFGQLGRAFRPDLFVDITQQWTFKRQALLAYEREMREFPHVRSFDAIAARAVYWGTHVGVEKAECFQTIWRVA